MSPTDGTETAQTRMNEIEVRSVDGCLLRGRWWRRPAPRGVVVVVHGFGEHGGGYRRVAEMLGTQLDVDTVAVDLRGHGKSSGRRGVVRDYDELTGDLESAIAWTARQFSELPRFVLAHSNGGQVALRVALRGRSVLDGLIVSNPVIRVAVPIPALKLAFARVLRTVAPWFTLQGELNAETLTRDPEIQLEHRIDPLRHSRMSAPLFFGMVEGGEMLLARAPEIHMPVLMLLGGQDPVVDPATSREFFDRLGSDDKLLHFYPKMLHEPLNELGREQVYDDVVRWLAPRLAA
jgi:lysophospholipase